MPKTGKHTRKEPTEKQKRFAHNFIQSANAKQSAIKAYPNIKPTTAEVIGHRNIHNPVVIDYMNGLLNDLGLTDEYIGLKIKTILDKSVTKQSLKHTQPSDGIRIAEMLFRLKDKFPAERKQITKQELRLSLSGKTTEELQDKLTNILTEARKYKVLLNK